MDRKVGSDEWSESVPRTCDWRKKSGVISSVKDQVSAPTQPQWWEEEEKGKAWTTYPALHSPPSERLQVLLGHGGSGQHRGPVGH